MKFLKWKSYQQLLWLIRPFLFWIKSNISPSNPADELGIDPKKPTVYVLPKRSIIDTYVLMKTCKKFALPIPGRDVERLKKEGKAFFHYLSRPGFFKSQTIMVPDEQLMDIIRGIRQNTLDDVQVVPVSILWGKDPGKEERSLFKLLFNDDEYAGFVQKFFIVSAHGRNNFVLFSKPISLKDRTSASLEKTSEMVQSIQKELREHFRHQRSTILGRKLYDRAHVIHQMATSPLVSDLINSKEHKTLKSKAKLETKARKYAHEISSDMNYSMIRFCLIVLRKLWNKMFDGIVVKNLDTIKKLAEDGYEIVYVPNHRSHLDYLLVNYSIYISDLPTPHTAAGINLNFWPVGGILRRIGAFYMRRHFRGNRIYTAVFREYLHFLLTNGYPISFFPEGQRSRTGRLLPLKTGLLSMIVHSFLRDSGKKIAFVPVSVNYDKIIEVNSYLKELGGDRKEKNLPGSYLKR